MKQPGRKCGDWERVRFSEIKNGDWEGKRGGSFWARKIFGSDSDIGHLR